jgi:hypothetical protein
MLFGAVLNYSYKVLIERLTVFAGKLYLVKSPARRRCFRLSGYGEAKRARARPSELVV